MIPVSFVASAAKTMPTTKYTIPKSITARSQRWLLEAMFVANVPILWLDRDASRLARPLAGALCQGIAQLVARFFGFGFKPLDQLRMLSCDIGGFADVVGQIV